MANILGVSLGGSAPHADLGGSSTYSNGNFEGWFGVGFHVNNSWTWVSRPSGHGVPRTRRLGPATPKRGQG